MSAKSFITKGLPILFALAFLAIGLLAATGRLGGGSSPASTTASNGSATMNGMSGSSMDATTSGTTHHTRVFTRLILWEETGRCVRSPRGEWRIRAPSLTWYSLMAIIYCGPGTLSTHRPAIKIATRLSDCPMSA